MSGLVGNSHCWFSHANAPITSETLICGKLVVAKDMFVFSGLTSPSTIFQLCPYRVITSLVLTGTLEGNGFLLKDLTRLVSRVQTQNLSIWCPTLNHQATKLPLVKMYLNKTLTIGKTF